MSGYRFNIIIELEDNQAHQTIESILKPFYLFIRNYIKDEISIEIISTSHIYELNNVEILLYDGEWPFTSFILFFEKHGYIKYLSLNDGDNAATDLMMRNEFYDKLLIFLNNHLKVKQSAFMCDPYYKSYEQAFEDISKGINKNDLNVRKYSQS